MCEEGKERMGEKEFKAKGFLLYTDDEDFFKDLDDDEAGILIKALFRYFNRGETPKEMPKIIKMPFNVLKKDIDRDVRKYMEDIRGKSARRKKQWEDRKGKERIADAVMQVHADAYNRMETKTQTKTQARAEAQTEALAKTKTKKTEVDASLVGGSASPPSMEETYGKSNGNSVYHAVIGKMLDERDKEDVVGI